MVHHTAFVILIAILVTIYVCVIQQSSVKIHLVYQCL